MFSSIYSTKTITTSLIVSSVSLLTREFIRCPLEPIRFLIQKLICKKIPLIKERMFCFKTFLRTKKTLYIYLRFFKVEKFSPISVRFDIGLALTIILHVLYQGPSFTRVIRCVR